MTSNHHPPPSINHQSTQYSHTYYSTGTSGGAPVVVVSEVLVLVLVLVLMQ
jgi:hypothetical protein